MKKLLPTFLFATLLAASCAPESATVPPVEPSGKAPLSAEELKGILMAFSPSGDSAGAWNEFRSVGGEIAFVESAQQRDGQVARKVAVWADGTLMPRELAHKRFVEEHKRENGVLTFELAKAVRKGVQEFPLDIVIWMSAERSDKVRADIVDLGEVEAPKTVNFPFVFTRVSSAEQLLRVASIDGVTSVTPYVWDEEVPQSNTAPSHNYDVSEYLRTDLVNNLYHADGVPIAVMERAEGAASRGFCAVNEDHESLALATINYTGPNPSFQTCSTINDCQCSFVSGAWLPSRCDGGICRGNYHRNWMASTIARSLGIEGGFFPYHAAKADLHFLQDQDHSVCQPNRLAVYLAQLLTDGVALGVRSVTCLNDEPAAAAIYDHFAREEGFMVVQPSGNSFDSHEDEVRCLGTNSICVGGTSHKGTHTDFADDRLAQGTHHIFNLRQYSRGGNVEIAGKPSDRERPDLVAVSDNIWAMDFTSLDDWVDAPVGTSYAAAGVTGLLAITWEYCSAITGEPIRNFENQLMWRARMRVGSNPNHTLESYYPEFAYPTPGAKLSDGTPLDSMAGAGIASFAWVRGFCRDPAEEPPEPGEPGGPWYGDVALTVTPEDAEWEELPSEIAQQEAQTGQHATSQALKQAGGMQRPIYSLGAFPQGGRVRASLAMNSCPGALDGTGAGWRAPSVDFDLVLCEDGVQNGCLGISESFYAADEGFDIIIPEDTGPLTMMIVGPEPSAWPSCESSSGNSEDTHVSYAVWRY